MKSYGWIMLGVLLALLAGLTSARAAPTVAVDWYVIASGDDSLNQGTLSLHNTVGQPVAERYDGAGLCAGFWCQEIVEYHVFLPLVLRDF